MPPVSPDNQGKVDGLVADINKMVEEKVTAAKIDSDAKILDLERQLDTAKENARKEGEVSFYEAVKKALGFGDF
jgi:hypothetical protein